MRRRHFLTLTVPALATASAGCLDAGAFDSEKPAIEPLEDFSEDPWLEAFPRDLFVLFPNSEGGRSGIDESNDASTTLALRVGDDDGEAFEYIVVLADDADGVETTLRLAIVDDGWFAGDPTVVSEETVELSRTAGAIYLLRQSADYELTLETADRTEVHEVGADCDWGASYVTLTDDGIYVMLEGGGGDVCDIV